MAKRYKLRGAFKTYKAAARVGHDFILRRRVRGQIRYIPLYRSGRKR